MFSILHPFQDTVTDLSKTFYIPRTFNAPFRIL